jgi:hypothetical protein
MAKPFGDGASPLNEKVLSNSLQRRVMVEIEKSEVCEAGCGDVESQLKREFNRLRGLLGFGFELELVWIPGAGKGLSAEVKDGRLYIYEEVPEKALQALRHELVDYLITSKIVEPLVSLINTLIKSREAEIYRAKEVVVEKLVKLLG